MDGVTLDEVFVQEGSFLAFRHLAELNILGPRSKFLEVKNAIPDKRLIDIKNETTIANGKKYQVGVYVSLKRDSSF